MKREIEACYSNEYCWREAPIPHSPPGEMKVLSGTKLPKVAVLVLNYNGKTLLEPCFRSLVGTDYPGVQLYLVDNGSNDGSVEFVQREFPQVNIIRHPKNYGFCEGYNQAIQLVTTDYIVLLNNDTQIVNPDWITDMVNAAEEDERIAAVAGKILFMNDPKLIDSVGVEVYGWTRGMSIGFGEKDQGQYDAPPVEPFAICGGAALIRRSAFIEVEGFDPLMLSYGEDMDLCWRLRLRGYRVAYVPSAVILHHLSGSWGTHLLTKSFLVPRNFLRTMIKNYSTKTLLCGLPNYFWWTIVTRTLGYLLWFRKPLMALSPLKAVLWNLFNLPDSLRQRKKIQSTRVITDEQILKAMGRSKIEPLHHMIREARKMLKLQS